MSTKSKKIFIAASISFVVIISSCIIIYINNLRYLKENTVTFQTIELEELVRHELSLGDDVKLMTWDLDKVKHICFADEYGKIKPSPEDISELKKLRNLEELTIQSLNSKTNIDEICNLKNLKSFTIYKKVKQQDNGEWEKIPLENLEFLKNASNIKLLRLKDCGLNDISGIKHLTSLTDLEIQYNQVEDISVLAFLPKFERLCASENKIKNISALEKMQTLNYVNLSNNPVAKEESYKKLWILLNERRKETGLKIYSEKDIGIQ